MNTLKTQGTPVSVRHRQILRQILRAASILTALAAAVHGAPSASAQSSTGTGVVLSDKDAYLLSPAELISGPVVQRASISPRAENLVVLRETMRISGENLPSQLRPNPPMPPREQELVFWNAAARRPISLWESVRPTTSVTLSEWMPGTASLFAVIEDVAPLEAPPQPAVREWKLLLLGRGLERAHVVPLPTGKFESVQVDMSPLQSLAVVRMDPLASDAAPVLILIHANGRVGPRIDPSGGTREAVTWDAAGNPVLAVVQAVVQKDSAVRRAFYSIDIRTGQTRLLPKAPQRAEAPPAAPPILPFHLVTARRDIGQANTTAHLRPIWLETDEKSEESRELLTANGSDASLLPDAAGALFKSQNAFWFTPILRVNRVEYITARQAARRAVAISNAKQLGLAALMFAEDNDEVLPGPDGIQDKLSPFLKNDILFEGFTYTYPGSTLADIEAPAETVLGHVDGPGGRAVIYADGHVKWKND